MEKPRVKLVVHVWRAGPGSTVYSILQLEPADNSSSSLYQILTKDMYWLKNFYKICYCPFFGHKWRKSLFLGVNVDLPLYPDWSYFLFL